MTLTTIKQNTTATKWIQFLDIEQTSIGRNPWWSPSPRASHLQSVKEGDVSVYGGASRISLTASTRFLPEIGAVPASIIRYRAGQRSWITRSSSGVGCRSRPGINGTWGVEGGGLVVIVILHRTL